MGEVNTPGLPASPAVRGERGEVPFAWILAVFLRRRRFILSVAAVGFSIALVAALLNKPLYTAMFSFTQSGQDQNRSGLANLAGQLGISVEGSSTPPQMYADLLSTRQVLAAIARDSFPISRGETRRVPLAQFLEVGTSDPLVVEELTIRALRKLVSARADSRTTGVVTVKVTTRSPLVSFEISRRLLEGLNQFNLATRKSQAGEERRFTEARLRDAKGALRMAEDALQNFMVGNRQLNNAPQLSFQRERLQREVSLQQQVVTGLAQQYEDARIREVRDTPVITVIEKPTEPVIADPRGRGVLLVVGTLIALLLALALVLAREGWVRMRQEESGDTSYALLASEWQSVTRRRS